MIQCYTVGKSRGSIPDRDTAMASRALGTSREGSKHGTTPDSTRGGLLTKGKQTAAPGRHRQEDRPNPHNQHPHTQRQGRPTTGSVCVCCW